jgi:hypothetical protein
MNLNIKIAMKMNMNMTMKTHINMTMKTDNEYADKDADKCEHADKVENG